MELVRVKNNQPVTTSLEVAKVFGKQHKDVMKRIREISDEITKAQNIAFGENTVTPMFIEGTHSVEGNFKKYPMYYMTKNGFVILVMGFSGKKAIQFKLQYISEFDRMAEKIASQIHSIELPQTYAEALRQLASVVEENNQLKLERTQLDFEKEVLEQSRPTSVLYTADEIASELGLPSARFLNNRLNELRVIYFQKGLWHLYYPYKNKGLKDLSTRRNSQMWTMAGKKSIADKLKNKVGK